MIKFHNLCFLLSLEQVNASRASLIEALNRAVIALASRVLLKERLERRKLLGIVLCLSGAALLIFGCVLGWGVYSLFSKGLNQHLGPLQTVTYSILPGAVLAGRAVGAGDGVGRGTDSWRHLPVQQTPCRRDKKGDFIMDADKGFYAV